MTVRYDEASGKASILTIRKPMNAHGHPRISDLMKMIVPHIKRRYYACVAMPNPKNFHITSVERLIEYHRQLDELTGGEVQWLMKLYLTETLTPHEAERACELPYFAGPKYFPRGLTTNSDEGISDPSLLWTPGSRPFEVLRVMTDARKPNSYHGANGFDKNGVELDPYEQERSFYRETFPRILDAHPDGIHIGEHVSSIWGVEFWRTNGSDGKRGCTITPHHAHLDRRDVYRKGFHHDLFCWPTIQSAEHLQEIRKFTTEGHSYVALGDDGAGHPREAKECGCCAGGIFNCPVSVEHYTEIFANMEALENFEAFASLNGPRFYGIKPSDEHVTLVNEPWTGADAFECEDGTEVVSYRHPDRDGKGIPDFQWKLLSP